MATQPRSSGADRARSHLASLVNASKAPGIAYVLVDSTRVRFEFHGGWADIRRRAPVDAATTMMAYSMSKTLTAVAVLQLVESGKVALEDSVDRYVASWPYGPAVTIRQLLSHTAGVPNPIPLRWVHSAARHATFDEDAALAAVLRDHPRLSFRPGSRFAYSNIGYWILGNVVARISGGSFPSYVSEHILRPLGIIPAELGYIVADSARHATGYLEKYSLMNLAKRLLIDRDVIGRYAGRWLEIRSHLPDGPAFGGLIGTARGFGKFLQDQLNEHSKVLDGTTRRLLYTPQQTSLGLPVAMTLGWHIGDRDGSRFFYKEGGGGGFHSMMRVYPASGVATVLMTNAAGFDVRACLRAVDGRFLDATER
jgi:CubicO group peptidase (beta-lactamase class C family)